MLKKIISGGRPGVESAALRAARRAGLRAGGRGGERRVEGGEPEGGGAEGEGAVEGREQRAARGEEVKRNCREAGGTFFIARAGHNPNNRVARAAARTRRPYSSIDCSDPEQTGQRLLNFLVAYRPEVLHITGTADFSKGRAFESGVAAALEKVLRRAIREGLAEPALDVSA